MLALVEGACYIARSADPEEGCRGQSERWLQLPLGRRQLRLYISIGAGLVDDASSEFAEVADARRTGQCCGRSDRPCWATDDGTSRRDVDGAPATG